MATGAQPNPLLQLTPNQVNRADSAQWRAVAQQASNEIRCAIPGFLTQDMDVSEQTVTVQIAIQERVRLASGVQWWDVPPIVHVPVMVPRGGGFAITLPLKKGDEGMLIFCDACIDFWWANGQTNAPVAANLLAAAQANGVSATASGSQIQNEVRRHYVHDCGFYPGLWSQKRLLSTYSADSLQIRTDDGTTTVVDVSTAGVSLTGAAITAANGGTKQALVTDAFYQWFVTDIMPFLTSKGYAGVGPPSNSETTIFEAQ